MELRGSLVSYEPYSGNLILHVGRLDAESVGKYLEKDLAIEIKEYRKKRSLDSNAYFHKLVSLIADAINSDNVSVKNRLIRSYGQYEYIDGKIPTYLVKADFVESMLNNPAIHFTQVGYEGDRVKLAVMRGSSTYDSKEMARLIDGAVQEAKELGIETMPPDELKRMVDSWKPSSAG